MGGLFRSEPMKYVRLLMTEDSAHDTIRALGSFGKLHLVDLSGGNQSESYLYFKKRVVACDAWLKKLDAFADAMKENGVAKPGVDILPVELKEPDVLVSLKRYLDPLEEDLGKNIHFRTQHNQLIAEQIERKTVLEMCQDVAPDVDEKKFEYKQDVQVYGSFQQKGGAAAGGGGLSSGMPDASDTFANTLWGLVPLFKQTLFNRMLFRASRGNVFVRFFDVRGELDDPQTGVKMKKSVFQIIFVGQQLRRRIGKICNFFNATIYPVPSNHREVVAELQDIQQRLIEHREVMDQTNQAIFRILSAVAFSDRNKTNSPLVNWYNAVKKEKCICDAFKKCDINIPKSKMITVEGWIPADDLDELRNVLTFAVRDSRTQEAALQEIYQKEGSPPTYFKVNKFTTNFQAIVDTYGVPRYQEVNPGLFTIITFPFLFGVMYGDIGHGTLLTLASMYMIYKEKELLDAKARGNMNEIIGMAFGGRYLIFCMGCFAIYNGFIYNDCMSIPINMYGSHWSWGADGNADWANATGGVYPFGMDPYWYNTNNQLAFFNSFKMKLSVILGVIQMTFGVFLSLSNHLYFHDYLHVFHEFVPRLLFLLCTFGYMDAIIIYKMTVDWTTSSVSPPNLVQTMIQMFLAPGSVPAEKQLYAGQGGFQAFLLVVAFLSVPWMLCAIPCITNKKMKELRLQLGLPEPGTEHEKRGHGDDDEKHPETEKSKLSGHYVASDEYDEEHDSHSRHEPAAVAASSSGSGHHEKKASHEGGGGGHGHFDPATYVFSDHMITGSIHTIEYVLGTVSNTASYLRLWALSLAHAELSEVFWSKMIMQYGLQKGPVFGVIGFGAWFGATFAVLLCMDVLECFLHALRLHWVEFQSKFFSADGYRFSPFIFNQEVDSS